jgi:hypothetical protein
MCKSIDGRLMTDKESVLRRWRERFDGLLNKETLSAFESSPMQSTSVLESQAVSEPTMKEVKKALQKFKNKRSPGIDTISSELIKVWWRQSHKTHL